MTFLWTAYGCLPGQHVISLIGNEEHQARVASVSLGLVLLILIPSLLLLVCAAHYWIREKIAEEEAAAALIPRESAT